ncbi:MAG TPA: hypothetical protein VHN14_03790, partial [Kofleriaceae bacterium]|nr:hypothetical protein [Kofleriaceae bacterium]
SMTVPLVILAAFASFIGFIGLPHVEHPAFPAFTHALAHWLESSVTAEWYASGLPGVQSIAGHASDATTFLLMGIALVVAIAGITGAYLFYGRGPSKTVNRLVDGPLGPVYEASKHKLWIDEFYDKVFVRPFKMLTRGLFEIADRFIIDTVAVNGAAFVIGIFGRMSRWFQNGNVQRYLVGVVVGGALVFFMTDCHHKATFEYKIVGNQLRLHADPGSGIEGARAKISWDLDGDGQKDRDPEHPGELLSKRDVTVTGYDGPITMWVEDPITRKEIKVTRTINLNVDAPSAQGAK